MEFDRKREDELQLRDVVPEQQEEHALEVAQIVRNVPAEVAQLEAAVEVMPAALPLELWANDLLEDAKQTAKRREASELQRMETPSPLFAAPRGDVEAPNDPMPYLFSAARSEADSFGGDGPPTGPPSGGPPGSGSGGSGVPPPPSSPPDSDDDKPDVRDARTQATERGTKSSAAARAARSSPGISHAGTPPASNRKK